MAASAPLIERPWRLTTFALPTAFVANDAVAEEVESVTTSLPCLPTSAADPRTSCNVAFVVESYTRLFAVMPETVSSFAKIDAVVVGWVSV